MRLLIALAIAGTVCCLLGTGAALDPLDAGDAARDDDNDGLINLEEFIHGTDPTDPDTDADGCPDGWTVYYDENRATWDPDSDDLNVRASWEAYARYDSDGDGAYDVNVDPSYGFDPNGMIAADGSSGEVDSDLWSNLQEYRHGTDPTNPDTDGDRRPDDVDPEPLIYDVPHIYACGTQPVHGHSGQRPILLSEGAGMAAVLGFFWDTFVARTS